MSGPAFRVGHRAERVEFRSTDIHGREVDTSTELPTQRDERIRQLQALRDAAGYRDEAPSASPANVINECRAADPSGPGAGLAAGIASGAYPLPVMVVEAPGRPADYGTLTRLKR